MHKCAATFAQRMALVLLKDDVDLGPVSVILLQKLLLEDLLRWIKRIMNKQ